MTSERLETEAGEKVVYSICKMCSYGCGIKVNVKDGRAIKVEVDPDHYPGHLCVKAEGMLEWVYSPERLTHPLKRENGGWKRISWDEAISIIADKLTSVKEKYGAKAFVYHSGSASVGTQHEQVVRRFCDLYGTPNFTTGRSFCFANRVLGHSIALGCGAGNPDYENTKCLLIIGQNATESRHWGEAKIREAKQRGAKLIMVDPRKTPLAKEADIYTPIRPSTDCAFVLALLNVIIEEELYDKDFVANWAVGFNELAEHVKQYSPEKVQEITWVPAETIREIARTYATNKPSAAVTGISIDHSISGSQTCWAVANMIAICGNFDIPGGNFPVVHIPKTNTRFLDRISLDDAIGAAYPAFSKFVRESTVVPLPGAIINGVPYPVKAMVVQAANPALTFPNTHKAEWALRSLDFLVVIDLFMTDTAKLADIVLPAATCLEQTILDDQGSFIPVVAVGRQAIKPIGESIADWKVWALLAKKMGYGEYFPWETDEELLGYILEPSGVSLEQLKEKTQGFIYERHGRKRYLENGFNTESKKVELYSKQLERWGYPPLPTYTEPAESYISKPELAEKYPLILMTGPRTINYVHTQFRNVPTLRKMVPEPLVQINTGTARELNIADGEMVTLESPRGSLKIKATLTDDIHPEVLCMPHGWSEVNANILTYDMAVDRVSAYTAFRAVPCRIMKD